MSLSLSLKGGMSLKRPGGLGPELVTNGTFAADASWTKGSGWTISGGVAVATAANSTNLSSNGSMGLSTSKTYRVTYTVSNYSAGQFNIRLGNNSLNSVSNIAANGDYSHDIQPGNVATDDLSFFASAIPCTLNIDNVSVKQIL